MLGVGWVNQLHGNIRLEAGQDLRLIRKIFEGLSIIFVTCFRGILTFNIINAIATHLLAFLIFLIVAENVSDFEGGYIAQICIEEG